ALDLRPLAVPGLDLAVDARDASLCGRFRTLLSSPAGRILRCRLAARQTLAALSVSQSLSVKCLWVRGPARATGGDARAHISSRRHRQCAGPVRARLPLRWHD